MGEEESRVILFLDDNPLVAATAYHRMSKIHRDRVIWCKTAEEAIVTIKDYAKLIDLIDLDYDLEETDYIHPGNENCGMEVVRYIEQLKKEDKDKFSFLENVRFVVHSWNKTFGPKMVERLREIGIRTVIYSPFDL